MKKKVLSIILALSMLACMIPAGALTAMAATNVAKIGSQNYTTFESALTAAKAGDTITLLKDVSYATNGSGLWNITKSITLDGDGHSLNGWGSRSGNKTTLAINNSGSSTVNVTLKNLTINNAASAGRVIETRGKIGTLTLDNVIVNATGSGNTQGLTIGGSQTTSAAVVIKNQSEINAGDGGYPIIIFNPVNMNVENSTLSGYCAVYFKGINSSAGSANSVVLCDRAKIVSPNTHQSGDGWNNFGAFVFEDKNGNTKVTLNDCEIHSNEENTAHQFIFAPNLTAGMSVGEKSNIVLEITGDSTIVNTDHISKMPIAADYTTKMVVYSGIYSTNELLEQLVATGYKVIDNPDTMTKEKYPYKVVPNDYNPDANIVVPVIAPDKKTEILNKAADEVEENAAKEAVKTAAAEAVKELTGNDEVVKIETNVAKAVQTGVDAIIARAVTQAEAAEIGSGANFTGKDTEVKTEIEVKLESINVDKQSVVSDVSAETVEFNKVVYDVKPIADVTTTFTDSDGKKHLKTERVILTDDDLNGEEISVRLPVPATDAKLAKVTHKSGSGKHPTEIFYAAVQGTAPKQYIDIGMTHFSEVEIETLTKTVEKKHIIGHQERSDNADIGRVIIPLTDIELADIGDKVTVVGGDKDNVTGFTVDCAYTYFFNNGEKIQASDMGYAAFIIIEKDGHGSSISGYGTYRLYNGIQDEANLMLEVSTTTPIEK